MAYILCFEHVGFGEGNRETQGDRDQGREGERKGGGGGLERSGRKGLGRKVKREGGKERGRTLADQEVNHYNNDCIHG